MTLTFRDGEVETPDWLEVEALAADYRVGFRGADGKARAMLLPTAGSAATAREALGWMRRSYERHGPVAD